MIECSNIIKEFGNPPQRILHDLSFQIPDGEFVSISGKSGSGKSTLLYIISTLDFPTSGKIKFDGTDISKMTVDEIHDFRNRHTGFIFQFHYLLPELTTFENILLPARNLGLLKQKHELAKELMDRLEISDQQSKYPSQMSGGQQQRVAIARALIMQPKYIFADEPTGNLDSKNGQVVMEILKKINKENGTTVILVTHEPSYAKMASKEIFLVDGKIA